MLHIWHKDSSGPHDGIGDVLVSHNLVMLAYIGL